MQNRQGSADLMTMRDLFTQAIVVQMLLYLFFLTQSIQEAKRVWSSPPTFRLQFQETENVGFVFPSVLVCCRMYDDIGHNNEDKNYRGLYMCFNEIYKLKRSNAFPLISPPLLNSQHTRLDQTEQILILHVKRQQPHVFLR